MIHPTAVVDEGAKIGEGTKIWHFTHVCAEAEIGKNCSVGQNCFIANKVKIGDGVKIQNNVSVYEGVILEDDVFVGPSAVFTNVVNPRSFIVRRSEFKTTLVGRGASIGANSTIVCGNQIGQFAFIGAGAVLTKNVPDFALFLGNPARQVGWVSRAGHRLSFDENDFSTCPETGEQYFLESNQLKIKTL